RELQARANVTVIAGQNRFAGSERKAARSDKYAEAVRDFVNPLAYARFLREVRRYDPQAIYFLGPHALNAPLTLLCRLFTDACVIGHVHDAQYAGSPLVATAADAVARL